MQNVSVRKGNIFSSRCQTIVNTVNCVGIMGAGIALECRLRYPQMFEQYARLCADAKLDIGQLWVYKAPARWVLNFPTKKHWRYPSRLEYLHLGLQKFVGTYEARGITSVAFPLLGAQNGGLPADQSLALMLHYLGACSIPVEIYEYDPASTDDVFDDFKAAFLPMADAAIAQQSGLRADAVRRIRQALNEPGFCQLSQLAQVPGIGDKTLEKSFAFIARQSCAVSKKETRGQQSAFGF
ncbi:MAG: macro domain-containing protein [Comamonadaceae bacterium]|jgi:O-acetyl-ADP-ribose deacetylase (regulator of RNase III)|nr:macro domain-containing protein [Comamonadaceae bacterium]